MTNVIEPLIANDCEVCGASDTYTCTELKVGDIIQDCRHII